MKTHLSLFAKFWEPGAVKTRLAEAVGAAAAAAFHRASLACLLDRFATWGTTRSIVFSPESEEPAFRELAGTAWSVEPQAAGDLGARLEMHLARPNPAERGATLILGADSPNVPAACLSEARRHLESVPVVLGSARDGGYYLIGIRDKIPPIFAGIAWGTADVWRETVRRLDEHQIAWRELPQWYDVDTIDDLRQLAADLAMAGGDSTAFSTLRETVMRLLEQTLPEAD